MMYSGSSVRESQGNKLRHIVCWDSIHTSKSVKDNISIVFGTGMAIPRSCLLRRHHGLLSSVSKLLSNI